jgi:DNA (cytosine-5)-methyltransferase 1
MRFGSVCSGIEAASVAWHPLGWEAAWLSEIEPFPCAVLKHHYPNVPNHGDMTFLPEKILSGEVEAPDLFCGGTPCQAFSVAGLRNSLDDARGNLSLTFVGIANAIDHVRSFRRDAPAIIFWENVPGVLNTKDNAFGCFLGALAGESEPITAPGERWSNAGCVFGSQRTVAWRVLDAQYFGVAQRRRRVFVVASAREDFDPAEVLFEFEGLRRDTAPSREKGERIAASAGASSAERGNCRGIAPTLDANMDRKWGSDQWTNNGFAIIEPTIMSSGQANAEIRTDGGTPALTCLHEAPIILDRAAFNQGQNAQYKFRAESSETMDTLVAKGPHAVLQPIPIHDQATRHAGKNGEKTMGKGNGLGIGQPGDPMNTLTKGDNHAVAYNIAPGKGELKDDIHVTDAHISKTIDASGSNPSMHQGGAAIVSPTLTASNDPSRSPQSTEVTNQVAAIHAVSMAVRRLTPIECERLQGFPDNYSNIPWRGKAESPDGPRYKALGNSWAVPVVAWIGKRIQERITT